MKIAYVILAHKLPDQLERLVQRLDGPDAAFFVHIDKKAPSAIKRRMIERLGRFSNLHLLPQHSCNWAGMGLVRAAIEGLKAVSARGVPYDWVILLSGQDYPLKSNEEISRVLSAGEGKSFMEYFSLPSPAWGGGGLNRFESWHFHILRRLFAFPPRSRMMQRLCRGFKRSFPQGFVPYGGSAYWCMSRDCVEYVNRFIVDQPVFVKFFEHVLAPDEIFFQTVVMNSRLGPTVVNDNLRYIDWTGKDSAHPKTLSMGDLPGLVKSPKLFARKFDATRDAEVLDGIDRTSPHP